MLVHVWVFAEAPAALAIRLGSNAVSVSRERTSFFPDPIFFIELLLLTKPYRQYGNRE
jgi:hypothetical protein